VFAELVPGGKGELVMQLRKSVSGARSENKPYHTTSQH
jgi:hypothetical protein